MDKKLNKWLIIVGLLIISPILLSDKVIHYLTFIGVALLSFGLFNYTKWNIWIKIILAIILGIIIIFALGLFILRNGLG